MTAIRPDRRTTLRTRLRRSATHAVLVSVVASTLCMTLVSAATAHARRGSKWTTKEKALLRSMSLGALEPLAPDPSNKYGDDPRAAALGRALFFDTRLSGNGKVSCATCHVPAQDFQDGKPLANGVGTTTRRTMPVAGTARSPWQFWDGRADSQWAQALGPLESAVEHGGTRAQYAHVIADAYHAEYEAVFGKLPELVDIPRRAAPIVDSISSVAWRRMAAARRSEISRVYANIGKAIAAYERRIEYGPSRFDRYVDAELAGKSHTQADAFTSDEEAGLRLFIGKGSCVNCHNGALLTDNHFHNTGVPTPATALPVDSGRATGVRQALAGEFNCTSPFSDASPDECEELTFAVADGAELVRAYKTPSLRNVADRAPYMHAGQIASLADVIAHYSAAPSAPFGHSELKPLHLSTDERRQLEAFLRTLSGPLVAPAGFLDAPTARR